MTGKQSILVENDFNIPAVKLEKPFVKNLYDASSSNVTSLYSPILLSARINNTNSQDQQVLLIFEALDSENKIAKLDLQKYSMRPQSLLEFSPIWIPERADNYTIMLLAIGNLGHQIFSYGDSTNRISVNPADVAICSPRLNSTLTRLLAK